MQSKDNQKYGIYIPELKIFMYINESKEEFLKLLSSAGLVSESSEGSSNMEKL